MLGRGKEAHTIGSCVGNWSTEMAPGQETAGFSRKSQRVGSQGAAVDNM